MALIRNAIRAHLNFNQRIGCLQAIQVILITWLLWQPIHCNTNRGNQVNRSTKNSKQLNQNGFDPLAKHYRQATGTQSYHPYHPYHPYHQFIANQTNSSSNLNNLNLNYLLSVLQEDERQAIYNNVINRKADTQTPQTPDTESQSTQTFLVSNQKKEDSVDNNYIELGSDDKRDLQEANKLSLFSSSLNVIDVAPQDTQLAHSVLIIHKPKPNKTVKPTLAPQLLLQQSITQSNKQSPNKSPIVSAITSSITTPSSATIEYFATPVRNNHRPLFIRPFPGRVKTSTTTSTTTTTTTTTTPTTIVTTKSTPSRTTIYGLNAETDSQTFNTTYATTEEDLEAFPVIFNNNHKKQSMPLFTRQKLTSTEYALIFTTPDSMTDSDKTSFTEVPAVTSQTYTYRPPYVTTINQQKRPPMKIMTVNANRIRQPDDIYSEGITVLDPPFISGHPMKLPPNTTVIHKNLIVPMKEGRPKPMYPTPGTTQYPIYPIVAGITGWHTNPTTPWTYPIVTTSSPDKLIDYTQQTASTVTDTSETDISVTAQSVNRPTIITGQPMISSAQPFGQTSHLVTVTPVKTTASDTSVSASNTFLVTSAQTPRPSTSTTGYVNAIWAPPMPIASRPVQTVQASPVTGSWFSPFSNVFSMDPSAGSMFSFMNVMKTIMFTIMVFFLPPLTLAAALMQTAVG